MRLHSPLRSRPGRFFRAVVAFFPFFAGSLAPAQQPPAMLEEIEPLIPPGISDGNIELYGKLAYTWQAPEGTRVVEVLGNFSGRMGAYKLTSTDAVLWFRKQQWQDRPYLEIECFLWQNGEIQQPGGAVETGPALLVTLRTFGRLVLNADAHAAQSDADSDLYRHAMRAHKLLEASPPQAAEKSASPIEVLARAQAAGLAERPPPKSVDFSAEELFHEQHGDESVIIVLGDVRVSQGSPSQSGEYLEIRADAAVLYLNPEQVGQTMPGLMGEAPRPKKDVGAGKGGPSESPVLSEKPKTMRQTAQQWVSAVYLEGDVVLTRGLRMIRSTKLYYDFDTEQALILDAVTRAYEPSRSVPIYVRAQEIRQLNSVEYAAKKAQITTSEFHTPHVSIGAEKVILIDRTPRDAQGQITGIEAGRYKAYHTTLNLEGVPIAYWPFSAGDFSRDRMAFRSAKFGYNGDFGATFETRWYLFNLMGLDPPEGYDATLKMDYFTDRGPATGIDMDYERENYFGLFRSYYIHDDGQDELGPERSGAPDHDDRGRILWRHRQLLPKDWELSLETSYISDDNFLEQYERNEFENGKDQESLVYLLKRQDNWQFSTLLNYRFNEFLTQTEHLPDGVFSLIGEPLGDYATAYSESRLGVVRYRPDNRRDPNGRTRTDNTGETGSVVRGDTREELHVPLPELGPLKLTPYVAGRASSWDDGPSGTDDQAGSGNVGRVFGSYGIRGNMFLSKVDESLESRMLDLHRLRHIIKPDFALWNAHADRSPHELTPFDSGVEDIDDFGGGTVGLRQKFQTQRGGPGKWRTVDWIVFDVEAGFFTDKENSQFVPPDAYNKDDWPVTRDYKRRPKTNRSHGDYIASRPEDSISSNFLATNFQYRLSDTTMLVHDSVFDLNRGQMGTSNISLAVEREPRMSYFVGWRYIHDTENSLIAAGANYKLSEKHTVAIREMYDIKEGRNYSTELVYIRRWPRWYSAVALDVDRGLDDVGINFSVWPEGAPRLGLGSKRYTGLADSVGIQPR